MRTVSATEISVRTINMTALLSAIAYILAFAEFPVPLWKVRGCAPELRLLKTERKIRFQQFSFENLLIFCRCFFFFLMYTVH